MLLNKPFYLLQILVMLVYASTTYAAVLPDERMDAMVHSYDGGGVEVTGPAVLIRKNAGSSVSFMYNYYVDNITSASIDVAIGGSAYEEERTEQTLGIDYLNGKTTMNLSYTDSIENDYEANTLSFGISQDFFGDLSTISMGFSSGQDLVSMRMTNTPSGPVFSPPLSDIKRQNYRIGFSQILTKNATVSIGWETITDEATSLNGSEVTLNNPYRSYSFRDLADPNLRRFLPERYPSTRTSNALSIRGSYFVNAFKSAIHYEYRRFEDDWGIKADTFGLSYVHPVRNIELDFRWRYYTQGQADFYRDLFDFAGQFTFMARDKELSAFTSTSIGMSASYKFAENGWGWIDKGSLNLSYDLLSIEYENFLDATQNIGQPDGTFNAGEEPKYNLEADVIQAYVSIWF